MHKASSGNVTSSKGEEVKIVSRFLAPLCARDETARNIALAAARNTVEGWLGEVSSPIHQENDPEDFVKFLTYKRHDKRYDGTIKNSALDSPLIIKFASNEDFSPEKSTETSNISKKSIVESSESFSSGSFDCLDGRFGGVVMGYPSSSNTSGFKIGPSCAFHLQDSETRFNSISESEQQFCLSNGFVNDSTFDEKQESKIFKVKGKVKGSRQKQLEDDTELDVDRIYGKSPKFDDDFGYMANRRRNEEKSSYEEEKKIEGVMFNTLEGFNTKQGSKEKLEFSSNTADEKMVLPQGMDDVQDYLCYKEERKCSAGQIKGLLSQDEKGLFKSDRVLGSAEVSPGDVGRMLNLGNALDGPRLAQANKYLTLVSLHLPVILRLSVNCPFQNVRIKCAEILEMVKDRGLQVPQPVCDGPSAFVPTLELPNLNSLDEKTHMLLMDAFLQNNRLDHVSRVMSSHPSYLEHFLRTQHFILRGDGPLPYDYRHLIAIMAAGRHQCSYLINLQKSEFLHQGGDPSWLRGLKSIPSKLNDLYEINKILAHRPWLLNETHIAKLTKGADNWSLAEVVHAIVLLAHFHSLSSFVFSCGINEELDNPAGHHYKENIQDNSNNVQPAKDKLSSSPKKILNGGGKTDNIPSPSSSPSIVGEQEVGVETLMERMKRLSEKSETNQITQEELSKRFETVETQSAELAAAPLRNSALLNSDIGPFIDDPSFIYEDFAKRGQLNDIPTFRVQDYSWDDHGYSLVNRLYNDVGNLLDDKFKTTYHLTYYTMGTHNKVDTSRFRRAIWNYIQCMFGIRHDDYDYNEVNQLLERSLKTFIKSAVCYPERVTKRDYDRVMREFKHSEKVHVNLMILEARMQAELLYALRAVMRYMT